MTTSETIAGYAYQYWTKRAMTDWPEVRQVARALKIKQADIEAAEGNGDFCLTGYNIEGYRLGDLLVEAMTQDVEVAWCGYWLPLSHQCICGEHRTG